MKKENNMKKIIMFNHITVDGYFAGPNGEIDWFKVIKKDDEWEEYTHKLASSGNSTLIFGHTTYEMMKSYWPTPDAIKTDPEMAKKVNNSRKIIFSKTLKNVKDSSTWQNITLLNEINPDEIIKLKKEEDMTILGSGSIVQQFTKLGLIDEYSFVIVPIILGAGKSFFNDVKKIDLKLIEAKSFKNGISLLKYKPLK